MDIGFYCSLLPLKFVDYSGATLILFVVPSYSVLLTQFSWSCSGRVFYSFVFLVSLIYFFNTHVLLAALYLVFERFHLDLDGLNVKWSGLPTVDVPVTISHDLHLTSHVGCTFPVGRLIICHGRTRTGLNIVVMASHRHSFSEQFCCSTEVFFNIRVV